MCNIAGYVGNQPAAPILLEMLRRQEGLCGGYYTGIATIHEGKLHYAKLVGTVSDLETETKAASLPGTIGIIHSRSNSGGGDNWSHPFVRDPGTGATEAYVANGSLGCFGPRKKEYDDIADGLVREGFRMDSREPGGVEGYPLLSDGSGVHMSDVMCQLISREIQQGACVEKAMKDAFMSMPAEIVGLLISLTEPESIGWARINMPMNLAFAPHGAYLASSPFGFPADAGEPIPLPAGASGTVYPNRFTVNSFGSMPASVAPISARVRKQAYEKLAEALKREGLTIGPMEAVVTPLFPKADCVPATLVVYDVLHSLKEEGRLQCVREILPGAKGSRKAPKFRFSVSE